MSSVVVVIPSEMVETVTNSEGQRYMLLPRGISLSQVSTYEVPFEVFWNRCISGHVRDLKGILGDVHILPRDGGIHTSKIVDSLLDPTQARTKKALEELSKRYKNEPLRKRRKH